MTRRSSQQGPSRAAARTHRRLPVLHAVVTVQARWYGEGAAPVYRNSSSAPETVSRTCETYEQGAIRSLKFREWQTSDLEPSSVAPVTQISFSDPAGTACSCPTCAGRGRSVV